MKSVEEILRIDMKRLLLEKLLAELDIVDVTVAPWAKGVVLPEHLTEQVPVMLQIGLNLLNPIPDLEVTDEGWSGTLSFNRQPFHVTVPWAGVVGMGYQEEQIVWFPNPQPEKAGAEPATPAKGNLTLVS